MKLGNSKLRTSISYLRSLVRHAADFTERDHIGNEGGNQEPRFARDRQQNARAQNDANQHINQDCQSKFHYGDYKIFVRVCKQFNERTLVPHLCGMGSTSADDADCTDFFPRISVIREICG